MGKLLTRRRTEVRYTELFFFFHEYELSFQKFWKYCNWFVQLHCDSYMYISMQFSSNCHNARNLKEKQIFLKTTGYLSRKLGIIISTNTLLCENKVKELYIPDAE